jgi:hypothetical protein
MTRTAESGSNGPGSSRFRCITSRTASQASARGGEDSGGGPGYRHPGDILRHEYELRRGEGVVARISKHRFALSDTYGIETVPSEDDGLIFAVAVTIDEMAHDADGGDH